MSTNAVTASDAEAALADFLASQPADAGLQMRSLTHAWTLGGGTFTVGKLAIRLLDKAGAFTAGTLYAERGGHPARLELGRVLLEKHGVTAERWTNWTDEFADLAHHGFEAGSKYPTLPLGPKLTPGELARLVSGMRDLATFTQ